MARDRETIIADLDSAHMAEDNILRRLAHAESVVESISDELGGVQCLIDELLDELNVLDGGDVDESMDGDFDSGMASAGFGTDEDYGFYGEQEDSF